MSRYRDHYIKRHIEALRDNPKFIALWEAGSAATGTTDQYSDIDLLFLCSCETDEAFATIEALMPPISHRYIEPAGPDLKHRIYFHEDSPEHFYADIGVLREDAQETLKELMVIERHGQPIIYFDKKGLIRPHRLNQTEWQSKLETRVKELEDALPIYVTQVLKALDRRRNAEAFAFYYHGLLRKLVELLGMRFRPYRYDFELRYLERDFPQKEQESIHEYMKYVDPDDLRKKVESVEQDIRENITAIKNVGIRLI